MVDTEQIAIGRIVKHNTSQCHQLQSGYHKTICNILAPIATQARVITGTEQIAIGPTVPDGADIQVPNAFHQLVADRPVLGQGPIGDELLDGYAHYPRSVDDLLNPLVDVVQRVPREAKRPCPGI
jgi:hypothetical protein